MKSKYNNSIIYKSKQYQFQIVSYSLWNFKYNNGYPNSTF